MCASLVVWHFETVSNPRIEVLGSGQFRFYSRERIHSPLIYGTIQIATGFIYITTSDNAPLLRRKFSQIDGESLTLDYAKSKREILHILGYTAVSTQNNSVMQITYAYSGRGLSFIRSGRDRINLQISNRSGVVTVGWPVILGSY